MPQAPFLSGVLAAIALLGLLTELAPAVTTNWIVTNGFWQEDVLWDNAAPGADDTAVFRRGNVSPYAVGIRTIPANNPIHPIVNRLIIGTNTVYFGGHPDSTLTVERFGHLIKTGGDMIIGQTATDVAVLNSNITSLSVDDATIGSAAGSMGTLNLNENNDTFNVTQTDKTYDLAIGYNGTGTINISGGADVSVAGDTAMGVSATGVGSISITGSGSTWTSPGILYVGTSGAGTLNITGGGSLSDTDGYIGTFATSTSSATVSGAGSIWNNSNNLYVGDVGDATLNVTAGGDVNSDSGYIGTFAESTGAVTIDGNGSSWTSFTGSLYVGNLGHGTLNLVAGGDLLYDTAYIGYQAGSTGAATVSGAGSVWSNTVGLYVGNAGNGSLDVSSGGIVIVSGTSYIGDDASSMGDVTVDGAASRWTNTGDLYVGNAGNGTLNITAGGDVSSDNGYIGDDTGATGTAAVDGLGSTWTVADALNVGFEGESTLAITGGGEVSSFYGYLGRNVGGNGEVTIDGAGSTWTITNDLYVGYNGDGTLAITGRGTVSNSTAEIGNTAGSAGSATVDGAGSLWTCSDGLDIGDGGDGLLTVTNGGEVRSRIGRIADAGTSTGSVIVTGAGSIWTITEGDLFVGEDGSGTLNIESGGHVSNPNGFIGFAAGSTGTATVDGANSKWINSGALTINNGTLNVTNGGTVEVIDLIVGELGEVHGNGSIVGVVQNGGLVSPGTSPSTLTIDDDYAQAVGGELLIELASASSYDQLLVTDNATLDGMLAVTLIEGFVPSVGQSFTILTADDVDGTFATEMFPSVPHLAFDVIYNVQSVVVSVVPALAGDYNVDGIVDAADYVLWRKTDGTPGGYDLWRANFGQSAGSGSIAGTNATVPESTTLVMLIVAPVCIRLRRRQFAYRVPSTHLA